MTSTSPRGSLRATSRGAVRTSRWAARAIIGSFFLWTSGIHVGVAVVDPQIYRHVADAAIMSWVERGWNEVFMANPRTWGLAVAAGELTLGVLLLLDGRAAKLGWLGVIGFHLALVLFGWGFVIWSAPALAVLVMLTRCDWPRLSTTEPTGAPHGA